MALLPCAFDQTISPAHGLGCPVRISELSISQFPFLHPHPHPRSLVDLHKVPPRPCTCKVPCYNPSPSSLALKVVLLSIPQLLLALPATLSSSLILLFIDNFIH